MSNVSLGLVSSLATTSLAQTKGSEIDRTKAETTAAARNQQSAASAEAAAGIGDVLDQSATSDRDADGRRMWEWPSEKPAEQESQATEPLDPHAPPQSASRDASGESGSQLDLIG